MIDWSASMQQTFEFYEVDPSTWKDKKLITIVKTGNINRDAEVETRGSATFDITESVGECYIRVYLISIQGDERDKRPLGTFLAQTPASSFDGKTRNVSMDAYTPLLELKEKNPRVGYFIAKNEDVMEFAYNLTSSNVRAPVIKPVTPSNKLTNNFIADMNDNWLTFINDLITAAHTSTCYEVENVDGKYVRSIRTVEVQQDQINDTKVGDTTDRYPVYSGTVSRMVAVQYCVVVNGSTETYYRVLETEDGYVRGEEINTPVSGSIIGDQVLTTTNDYIYTGYMYETYDSYYCVVESNTRYTMTVDEMGRICYVPDQDVASMQPIWTYTDDNSSILYPELTLDHDLYGIPNVVEVVCSDGNKVYYSKATNDDSNSPLSTKTRGREIVYRITNPEIYGAITQEKVDDYAVKTLKSLSSVEYTVSYTHGYCPVRVGDCVRLNYSRAGINNVKAKVIRQSIKLEPGCPVTETAVFTTNLWG